MSYPAHHARRNPKPGLAIILVAALMLLHLATPTPATAQTYTKKDNLALQGYDTVAYFSEDAAIEGTAAFQSDWNGATWQFASAENKAAFDANPQAYAPQYGGYCAWAAARNKLAPGDPEYWTVVDDKLYVNYNMSIQRKWEKDIPGFIEKADAKWPTLKEKADK